MNTVDAVAKALCNRAGSPRSWDATDERSREAWRGDARAAVEAMHEPAREMALREAAEAIRFMAMAIPEGTQARDAYDLSVRRVEALISFPAGNTPTAMGEAR